MQDLTVIGVEDGALVVVSESGDRFRIVIDELLRSKLRQGIASAPSGKKVSPREIQTHIRAGLSAPEVAELTGADIEYIERFEGPVLAERQFMVDSALRVAVQPTTPADPLGEEPLSTFGDAIGERLEGLDAQEVRWASWKDETGWIVKLTFTSRDIEHDARWQFDPKRHVLTPLGNEAMTLSRHGELTEGLIPRLRAVGLPGEDSRFDSGAFSPIEAESSSPPAAPTVAAAEESSAPVRLPRDPSKPFDAYAAKRASEEADTADHNQTADLLEALRRRRGEREAAGFELDEPETESSERHPVFGAPRPVAVVTPPAAPVEVVDTPLDGFDADTPEPASNSDDADEPAPVTAGTRSAESRSKQNTSRRQRAAMPSWDEIVFGARSDDDPA
ncbi:septation protein SepH [Herbiconiux moechotypicola]|uniref:Septation protein SepH n=1 Tax=Herbiconiux moechotypicola TaxID=637393 RepID=A0ABN3D7E4_9MICO|nr:septation protein SepH [Herbiconiux moechotypicola]MCS5728563.1 septation protein SepH [Herbiconiux moechotypicola]